MGRLLGAKFCKATILTYPFFVCSNWVFYAIKWKWFQSVVLNPFFPLSYTSLWLVFNLRNLLSKGHSMLNEKRSGITNIRSNHATPPFNLTQIFYPEWYGISTVERKSGPGRKTDPGVQIIRAPYYSIHQNFDSGSLKKLRAQRESPPIPSRKACLYLNNRNMKFFVDILLFQFLSSIIIFWVADNYGNPKIRSKRKHF